MTDHLVFTLCAGLGAMGDLAGHERRGTHCWPGRSAVLGLLGAALGLRRDDAAGFTRLDALRLAVGVIDDGRPMRDFHTVQTVPTAAAKRPDSRAAALRTAGLNVNTTITLRDYRVGVAYAATLWGGPLDGLAEALAEPVFTLYLGRKSCPLSAPPAPRRVMANGPLSALRQAQLPPFLIEQDFQLVASDERIAPNDIEDSRNDVAMDRNAWHFTSRRVYLHVPEQEGEAA